MAGTDVNGGENDSVGLGNLRFSIT